ncbi:uncharacterized protein LOC128558966 isoform X2 [Mercenaria mercenaria]|nr:uncharacterized protein LOC128558966 isoform X2 [Mercenaria mercenaria]
MTSLILPATPSLLHHHPDHRFQSYCQKARNDELSLENLGIRRNDRLKSALQDLEHCKRYLENPENRQLKYFGHINRKLYDKMINIYIQHTDANERTILGNKLSRIGLVDTLTEFYDFVRNTIGMHGLTDARVKGTEDEGIRLLLTIRRVLYTFSKFSENVVKSLSETDLHRALLEDLQSLTKQELLQLELLDLENEEVFVFSSAMNILYECVRHPHTKRNMFRQSGILKTLSLFLCSKNPQFRLRTVLVLAYVLTEDKKVCSEIPFDLFDFLMDAINEAQQAKDRLIYGFSINELLDGLTAIQFCFPDKSHFMNKRPLPVINGLLESADQSDVLAALKLVWEISFCEQSRRTMQENEDLMDILEDLRLSNNPALRSVVKKTLFVLTEQGKRVKRTARKDLLRQHTMLSYNKSDQKVVLQVYHALRSAGLPVWIDVAEVNKYTNSLEGVLRAIEQANIVVVCFSESYACDQSCRMEAEYAFALKKRIIPLKLQSGYEPRGWLTSVIGSRFYQTLTRDRSFEKQMSNLRDYIQGVGATMTSDAPVSRAVSRGYMSRGPPSAISRAISRVSTRGQSCCPVYEKKVQQWDADDIILWATQFKLEGRAWRVVSKLTVQQILHIYTVWRKTPDYFYRWVESVIGLGSVEDLMRFRNAVRSLKDYI